MANLGTRQIKYLRLILKLEADKILRVIDKLQS